MKLLVTLCAICLLPSVTLASDLTPFPKWQHATEEMGPLRETSKKRNWRVEVARINKRINEREYISDKEKHGVEDYWSTPAEFDSGDCEDFAIAKYDALLKRGLADSQMEVVVARRDDFLMHAVLVVHLDGEVVVLDNEHDTPLPQEFMEKWSVAYYINRVGWRRGNEPYSAPSDEGERQ